MTPAEVGSLIASVGFPIVAAYFVWVFNKSRIESSEKASIDREAAASTRENKLGERIDKLQDYMRSELVSVLTKNTDVIAKNTDVMGESKEALQQCSGTLIAAASIMQDMKDEANRRARQTAST
jgi:hypothetical protein